MQNASWVAANVATQMPSNVSPGSAAVVSACIVTSMHDLEASIQNLDNI